MKKKNRIQFILAFAILLGLACNSDKKEESKEETKTDTTATTEVAPQPAPQEQLLTL